MLEVSPENLQISDSGEGTLTITSNTKWEVSTTADWLTFSTMSGMGNGQVTIRASGYSMSDRMAILTIKGEGISRQALVTQKGVVIEKDGILHVNVFKAGVFPDLIDSRKTSTTRLKIKGNLNGTDIISLREMMTSDKGGKLVYLDMSEASIVEGGEPYKEYYDKSRTRAEGWEGLTTQNDIISKCMFEDCDVIQELILPNSVVKISHYMFGYSWSSKIRSITIGKSTIGSVDHDDLDVQESLNVLAWMDKLEEINVHLDNPKYSSENGVMYSKDKTILYRIPRLYKKVLSLPNSLTTIGNNAFLYFNGNIKIPSTVVRLKDGAFWRSKFERIDISNVVEMGEDVFLDCEKLRNVELPKSLTLIPKQTFRGCSALESIIIPNSVTAIGDYSFSYCIILPSITIPESVRSIGRGAFYGCYNLLDIYMDSPNPPTANSDIRTPADIFGSTYKEINLYIPKGSKDRYASTIPWSKMNIIER